MLCPVPWSSMAGDERIRFGDRCRKNVYNVGALSPAEGLALVDRAEGGVCLRLTRRTDGTLVTGDCRARLRDARRRGRLAFAAALVVVFAVQVWTQAFGLRALFGLVRPKPFVTMGAMVVRR